MEGKVENVEGFVLELKESIRESLNKNGFFTAYLELELYRGVELDKIIDLLQEYLCELAGMTDVTPADESVTKH
jgi:hypothetical protein